MTPKLETCKALKEAGYPQELKRGQRYYDILYPDLCRLPEGAIEYRGMGTTRGDFIAIPTLSSLLDWFVKFAGEWAKKTKNMVGFGPCLDWGWTYREWHFKMQFAVINLETISFSVYNPDPLTAVLELFKQMNEEMK